MDKVCVSYSLGKDSTLALHRTMESGDNVIALIISIDEENKRSWFHGVESTLIDEVSASLNIPVIYAKGKPEDYRETFIKALKEAKALGATKCIFGDIDIEEHHEWCSGVCDEAKLTAIFPLWQEDRKEIVKEFIACGYKAVIKTISKKHQLPTSLLFKTLSNDVLQELETLNVDVCGENGEYHTFVYDGPVFSNPIKIKNTGVHESEYAFSAIVELDNE